VTILELEVDAPDIDTSADLSILVGAVVPAQVADFCAILVVAANL
jgi:hypothetical protein